MDNNQQNNSYDEKADKLKKQQQISDNQEPKEFENNNQSQDQGQDPATPPPINPIPVETIPPTAENDKDSYY